MRQKSRFFRRCGPALLAGSLCFLTGCDSGFRQMGTTEFGVKFRKLPVFLGGGLASNVISPGEKAFILPWETIYKFDTSLKSVAWGGAGQGDDKSRADYVYTRALDGNEVALAVTVRYRVTNDPAELLNLVRHVATSDEEVKNIVVTIARADIRNYMNELRTSAFLEPERRNAAVERVRASMESRLKPYGIIMEQVNLDDFKFERLLPDGTADTSYQDKLRETQKLREDTEREKLRIETVKAKKSQELNDAQGEVNRLLAEAMGAKNQAQSRGDSYYASRGNEAEGITAQGKAEVEGLLQQVKALSGPGGRALLKIELAKQILKNDPRYVVMEESQKSNSLQVKRVDTNELIGQIGALEAMKPKGAESQAAKAVEPLPQVPAAKDAPQ